nr:acetyl-CoA carboxylase subunit beta [Jasminum multiflorum]
MGSMRGLLCEQLETVFGRSNLPL